MNRRIAGWLLFAWLLALPFECLHGQLPRVKPERLGVDLVRLNDGTQLYGFVLRQSQDQTLELAVERAWLQATYPQFAAEIAEKETEEKSRTTKLLLERIDQWIQERDSNSQLVRYLRVERNYIESLDADSPDGESNTRPSQFILRKIAVGDRESVRIASSMNRRVAALAFENEVANVTITPASILRTKLEELGVDTQTAKFDLSDDLPTLRSESARAWAARKALVEYQMLEPVQYQGVGSKLFRTGDAAGLAQNPGDLLGLAQSMLGGSALGLGGGESILSIGAELGLPEFQQYKKPKNRDNLSNNRKRGSNLDWAKSILRDAEAENIRGVLVFRLEQNPLSDKVKVRTSFLAMLQAGEWFEAVRLEHTASAQQQSKERI
ncbi:MAG: hypothetical protein AAGG44_16330, partial [Planctomycetota bacterium]